MFTYALHSDWLKSPVTGAGKLFRVDATTGEVFLNKSAALDFETRANYTLKIEVKDDGSDSASTSTSGDEKEKDGEARDAREARESARSWLLSQHLVLRVLREARLRVHGRPVEADGRVFCVAGESLASAGRVGGAGSRGVGRKGAEEKVSYLD